jgi:hypothetical protein
MQIGCATTPSSIAPARVSADRYLALDCSALREERARVGASLADAEGIQSTQSDNDAAAMAITMLVFTPAMLAIRGNSAMTAEIARLKGEQLAIDEAMARKECK